MEKLSPVLQNEGEVHRLALLIGETGAKEFTPSFTDPERTIGTYAQTLTLDGTLEAFLDKARERTRLNWNNAYTADTINDYIREGVE